MPETKSQNTKYRYLNIGHKTIDIEDNSQKWNAHVRRTVLDYLYIDEQDKYTWVGRRNNQLVKTLIDEGCMSFEPCNEDYTMNGDVIWYPADITRCILEGKLKVVDSTYDYDFNEENGHPCLVTSLPCEEELEEREERMLNESLNSY